MNSNIKIRYLTTMKLYLLLLLSCARSQEVTTPSNQLKPRDFNPHPFLQSLNDVEPTKQGPVLFPNDAPPPPRPPLIVTSRPLLESIARSELGANNSISSAAQNSVTSQSQDRVSFVPFLARVKDYRPYVPSPTFDYQASPTRVPYADLLKKARGSNLFHSGGVSDNRYDDYEERTALPPVYKALANHAQQKVLKIQRDQANPAAYTRPYTNDINEENSEYDQNQNYAFSYTVKDQKTGDDFSHSQHGSGSATNGEYRVRLPDGRMQIVSYTADENGYKADVRYDDEDTGNNIDDNYSQHNANQHTNNNQHKYINQHNNYQSQHNDYDYQTPKYNYVTVRPSYVTPKYVTPQHYNYISEPKDYSRIVDYTDRSNKHDYDITVKQPQTNQNDKDYYQYPDVSKEYYNDYSSEYNNYEPHKSKFNFIDTKNVEITNTATASTVKPSYEELKDLFVTKSLYNTKQNYDDINVPSTTPIPFTGVDRVVNIGGKTPNLYTNIKHSLPIYSPTAGAVYSTPKVIVATSPKSYLVSTIASLKNKVSLATKPVLSDDFISRINKYINFN